MANLTLIWNNQSDSATLSGGSWLAGLPLSNMQDTLLKKTARSTNATTANTQFDLDLSVTPPLYESICLLSHNLSTSAQVRVRCSDSATFTTSEYDSGWVDAYAYSVPTTELPWESDNWWSGKPAAFDLLGYSLNTVILTGSLIDARYIRVEFDDTGNSDGYIEVGRLMVAPITELLVNMSYGANLAWDDSSLMKESIGGTEFFANRTKKRLFNCSAEYMRDDEALGGIFEMQKHQGLTGEIFVLPDRDNTAHSFRNSFLARMTQLGGIEKYMHNLNKTTYSFKELL